MVMIGDFIQVLKNKQETNERSFNETAFKNVNFVY